MIRQILAIFILVTSIAVYAQEPQLIPYRKGKLWGYSTPDKKMVIQPKWQETTFFVDGVAAVKQDNKWGLINEEGKEIIPIQYEYISNFVNGYAVARLPVPNSLQLINVKGEIKEYGIQASGGLDTELDGGYSSLSLYKSGLMALRNKDRKYGLTTIDGKEVLPFQYESIREMENGYLLTESEVVYAYKTKIIKLDPKMHYARHRQPEKLIDTKNKTITVMITKEEQKLLEAYGYSTEASQKGVKYEGLVSPNGEVILPAIYDRINKLNENLMTIEKDRKIGLVTVKGEQITLLKYSSIGEFSEGLATFSIGDKYGYMNEKGEEVIPAKYLRTGRLVNGYGFAEKETGWGFLSKEGEEIGSFEYSSVRPFSEGLAAVEKRYLVGYINEQGEEVIPLIYKQEIQPFTSGAAIMAKDAVIGRGQVYGIIDKKGNTIVPFRMNEIKEFHEGMARVMLRTPQGNKKFYGFVDSTGNKVIPIKYEQAGQFENGQIYVKENRNSSAVFLNKEGKEVEPLPEKRKTLYETGEDMGNGYVKIYKRAGYGYMNHQKVRYYED